MNLEARKKQDMNGDVVLTQTLRQQQNPCHPQREQSCVHAGEVCDCRDVCVVRSETHA